MGNEKARELIENMIEESDCDKCAGYGFFEEGCTTCVSTRVARILVKRFVDTHCCSHNYTTQGPICKNDMEDISCVKCMSQEFIEFIKEVEIE